MCADIRMCANQECKMRDTCYRANARISEWQSWCDFKPESDTHCEHWIEYMREVKSGNKMEMAMRDAWIKSRGNLYEPSYDFRDGFESCHDLLMPLLEMSAPHVFASAGAAHLTDGFKLRRHPIDELVERIKAVIPDA